MALPSQLQDELLKILQDHGHKKLDKPIQLASGALSSDFVDGKEALAEWKNLHTACKAIVETVTDAGHSFNAVGGLTMGADALAVGVAAVSDCRWFFVRKEPKQRGTRRLVEGAQIKNGDKVLLVDDVVTTGTSIFRALDAIDETGAETVAAVTLVDRSGLAAQGFEQRGIGYYPMTTYETLGIDPVTPVAADAVS
ncbi:MAG: phosphoribosyltransferase family protein [Acidimicrobiaceae bacterium]|nr:phosphoribosyltransferase family protein [Acidimicrobiaceae bacterium]